MTTVHLAGPVQFSGLYQECVRCGHVLQDCRGSQPMVVEGDDPTIAAWPEGRRVALRGNASWVVGDDVPLDPGEIECQPRRADSVLESLREWMKTINRINELSPLPTPGVVPPAAIAAGTAAAKSFMCRFPPPQPYGLAPTFGPRIEEVVEVALFAALGHGIALAAERQADASDDGSPEEGL